MPPSKWSGTCALRPECGLDGTRSAASVLVFACGNPSRGDDALGPLLLDRLRVWLATEELSDRFELLGDNRLLEIRAPQALARYIARKGSITVDGVSLTTNTVTDDTFTINLIPHTLTATTLGTLQAGTRVNLEVDLIARYCERLLVVSCGEK